jgi:hypothetical protein
MTSRLSRGFEVTILQESEGWLQVERGAVSGWVQKDAVGDVSPLGADTSVDSAAFFRQCWLEGQAYLWLPHYLAGVAKLRSGIKNDIQDDLTGLFRLTKGEWDAARNDPSLGLTDFAANDITNWGFQTAAFAAMTARDFDAARTALQRAPSAHEFYLAQLIGAQAMAAAVANDHATIATDLSGVQDSQLPPGGATRDDIVKRYSKYLLNAGPPPTSPTGSAAFALIATDLQSALDAVKDDIIAAGNDVLSVSPDGNQLIDDVKQPSAGQPAPGGHLPNAPSGPATGGKPGAGGHLGNLIARGEGDYGTFNRGNAGDSARQKINFSAMTIQQIMTLQALPPGHPQRLFAVGKYQVIPSTMRGAVAALNIDTALHFDPTMQEKVFRDYLIAGKRPNVKKYITSQTNNLLGAQFALALEFASVADPNTGRSHYGGMGGNRASISKAETEMALNDERIQYKENLDHGMDPATAWDALSGI